MPTNLYGPGDSFDLENSHVLPAMISKFHLAKLASQDNWEGIQKDEKTYGPIPEDIRSALCIPSQSSALSLDHSKPSVVLWGTGQVFREFLYVDDLADACVFVMGLKDAVYARNTRPMLSHINIGSGKDLTIAELVQTVQKEVGCTGQVQFDADMPDGTPRKLLDVTLLTRLGWRPRIGLRQGIRETYQWYQHQTNQPPSNG